MNSLKKFDNIDLKILAELYSDARMHTSIIAKTCRISKERALYRIKRLESEGIIKGYIPLLNYSALGYNLFYAFSRDSKSPSGLDILTSGRCFGEYSSYVIFAKKSRNRLPRISKAGMILSPSESSYFPLKIFGNKISETSFYGSSTKIENISPFERKILSCLGKDGTMSLVKVAKALKTKPDKVLYHLRIMKKKNIFLGSRAIIDVEKLGYSYYLLLCLIDNPQKMREIKSFAKLNTNVESISFFKDSRICTIQCVIRAISDLNKLLETINGIIPGKVQILSLQLNKTLNPVPWQD